MKTPIMKNGFIIFIAILFACSTSAPPVSVDAATPVSTAPAESISVPPPIFLTPQPTPAWMLQPRAPIGGVRAAGTRPPIIPTSWTVPAWVIDPANSSGNASDNNPCTTNASPCLTYAEIAARWGTYSPRLRQNTTLTWLSSQSGNTDPVYFTPFVENAALVQIIGTVTQVASITLGSVTAKTRATPQLLQADLGASGAVNQFLINTTGGKASRAWAYKVVAGTVFAISQPMTQLAAPPANMTGTEVDTWANTDTVTLNTLSAVDLVVVEPHIADASSSLVEILDVNVLSPTANSVLFINNSVQMIETVSSRTIAVEAVSSQLVGTAGVYNSDQLGGFGITSGSLFSQYLINAGINKLAAVGAMTMGQDIIAATGDFVGINQSNPASNVGGGVGAIFLDTSAGLNIFTVKSSVSAGLGAGPAAIWGPGSLLLIGNAHLEYPSGANQAVATFLLTGLIRINNQASACSHSNANNPDVINCAITINATNLDAAQSTTGFGGTAFLPGGASISNLTN